MKKRSIALLLGLTLLLGGCETLGGNESQGGSSTSQPSQSSPYTPGYSEQPDIPADPTHVDADNNGKCDSCQTTVTVTFDIFGLNDLHGKFVDTDTQPGVDELTTYLKEARSANENTILLSAGDMWQGSSESNLTKGKIITEWMNDLDFTSMALGNHEYDWGEDFIETNSEIAEFPFLAINIYDRNTNALVDYCQPSVMVEKNGAKIGIIGAVGDCYSSISSDKVQGIYFKTDSALTSLVKAESQKLRAEGADFIIYTIHDGYDRSSSSVTTISDSALSSYYDIALSDGYVDLVFEGHTHQRYVLKDSKGVYHLQDGGDNDGISHVDVTINYANNSYVVNEAEFVSTSTYSTSYSDDPIVNTLMEKYAEDIALAGKVLGKNDVFRDSYELRQIIADLYYRAAMEKWGDEYDIVLGGGYLSARSPYDLSAGTVTYGDLQMIFPFDNPLVLCSISGSNLRSQFFETSNSNYYISYGEYGASVKNNIVASQTYYIVTDTYSSSYGPNGLTEIARYDETTYARDLLADYIEAGGFTKGEDFVYELTSIPDALQIANALADNAETAVEYYVKGEIISIDNTTYGNMTIRDENGNTLYVYGVYDSSGTTRYDGLATKPQVGDVVVLQGKLKKYIDLYNNSAVKLEMVKGKVQSIE